MQSLNHISLPVVAAGYVTEDGRSFFQGNGRIQHDGIGTWLIFLEGNQALPKGQYVAIATVNSPLFNTSVTFLGFPAPNENAWELNLYVGGNQTDMDASFIIYEMPPNQAQAE